MIRRSRAGLGLLAMMLLAPLLISCGSVDPNVGRVLTSIAVTPTNADASQYPNGQVTFTATGSFSIAPLSGPVTFKSPYTGEFFVANPASGQVATVVTTGTGTVTVQCVSGVSASVFIVASASSNNEISTVVTGQGLLNCP